MKEMHYRLRRYPDGALTYSIRDVRFHVGVWTKAPDVIVRNGQEFPLAEFAAGLRDPTGRAIFDVTDRDGALAIEQQEVARAQRAIEDARLTRATGSSVEAAQVAQGAGDPGAEHFSKEKLAEERQEEKLAEEAKANITTRERKQAAKTEAAAGKAAAPTPDAPAELSRADAPGGRRAQRLARRGGASK